MTMASAGQADFTGEPTGGRGGTGTEAGGGHGKGGVGGDVELNKTRGNTGGNVGGAEGVLVRAVRQGDRGALGVLLERYEKRIYNVVLRMVRHHEDAKELTQDAMLRVVQHIDQYDGRAALSTWMIRIAMNLSISHLRKQKLRRAASLDADGYGGGGGGGGGYGGGSGRGGGSGGGGGGGMTPMRQQIADLSEPGPELRVEKEEMIQLLHTAVASLDEDLRSVIVLRDIDQMDYAQIAEVLDIPMGTVKSRLFRARLALRHEMYKRYPADEAGDSGSSHLTNSSQSSSNSATEQANPKSGDVSGQTLGETIHKTTDHTKPDTTGASHA